MALDIDEWGNFVHKEDPKPFTETNLFNGLVWGAIGFGVMGWLEPKINAFEDWLQASPYRTAWGIYMIIRKLIEWTFVGFFWFLIAIIVVTIIQGLATPDPPVIPQ